MKNGDPKQHNNEPSDKDEYSSPIEFPCDFMIKAMGKTKSDFEKNVLSIVKKHFPQIRADEFSNRFSKDNNYMAITVTVHAESKAQLDALYEDLSKEPTILMAL